MDEHPGAKKQVFMNSKNMLLPTITFLSESGIGLCCCFFPCGN